MLLFCSNKAKLRHFLFSDGFKINCVSFFLFCIFVKKLELCMMMVSTFGSILF